MTKTSKIEVFRHGRWVTPKAAPKILQPEVQAAKSAYDSARDDFHLHEIRESIYGGFANMAKRLRGERTIRRRDLGRLFFTNLKKHGYMHKYESTEGFLTGRRISYHTLHRYLIEFGYTKKGSALSADYEPAEWEKRPL